jgi:hypothetical protein
MNTISAFLQYFASNLRSAGLFVFNFFIFLCSYYFLKCKDLVKEISSFIIDACAQTRRFSRLYFHQDSEGNKFWFKGVDFHREDGPAVEFVNGNKFWFKNGKYHRVDGPAVEWNFGEQEWWLDGKEYPSKEEYFEALSPEQRLKFVYTDYF